MHKNGRLEYEHVTAIETRSPVKLSKNRILVMCALSNINKMTYFYVTCPVRVTIFSTGSKF